MLSALNGIHIDIPDFVPGIGGKSFGFNIPKIPYLAQGTVVTKPTLAMFGEAGPEVAMPLKNNTEWMDYLADMLVSKMGNVGNSEVPFVFKLDSKILSRGLARREREVSFARNGN